MNHYAGWKNALIVFFLFISTLYTIPNLYGSDLVIQITVRGAYVVPQIDLTRIFICHFVCGIFFICSTSKKNDDPITCWELMYQSAAKHPFSLSQGK